MNKQDLIQDLITHNRIELLPETDPPLYRLTKEAQNNDMGQLLVQTYGAMRQIVENFNDYLHDIGEMLEALRLNVPFSDEEIVGEEDEDEEEAPAYLARENAGYL